jgi:hypothetical protein
MANYDAHRCAWQIMIRTGGPVRTANYYAHQGTSAHVRFGVGGLYKMKLFLGDRCCWSDGADMSTL